MAMKLVYMKRKMISDIITICQLSECKLSKEGKHAILKDFSWRYAEMRDLNDFNNVAQGEEQPNKKTKKLGNKYWSEKALEQYKKGCCDKNLCFDHIVPKRIFIELFIKGGEEVLKDKNESDIRNILDKILVGCVITNDENDDLQKNGLRQKMPMNIDENLDNICQHRWGRYLDRGIIPKEVKWELSQNNKGFIWTMKAINDVEDYEKQKRQKDGNNR